MADKRLSEMTDEEIAALSDEERDELEQQEEEDGDGEPGSDRRRSLYSRFRQENERRKDAQRAAEEARRELEEERARRLAIEAARGGAREEEVEDPEPEEPKRPNAIDLAALRRQKKKALTDGEFDKAAEIEDQIDDYNAAMEAWREERDAWRDEIANRRISKATREAQEAAETASQRAERTAIERSVREVIKDYPFLDANSKDKDQDAIDAVIGRRDRYMREGLSAAEAIAKAGAEIGERFSKRNEKGGKGKDEERPERGSLAKEERRRGAAESERLPPHTAKSGARNLPRDEKGRIIASKLTDQQIRDMTPEQISESFGRRD
jgi:hypothetical protein